MSSQPQQSSRYESAAAPIKLGYLFDFALPQSYPEAMRRDLTQTFELVFREGFEQGIIDRPVEIVFREVEGLPKGTIKVVIDAYKELVEEGCLAVFGPAISDNCVPIREIIEQSLVGDSYIRSFRSACRAAGIKLVAEELVPQTAQEVSAAVQRLHEVKPDALLHCGFGFGIVFVNPALAALGWDPPRFMGTAFQNAWINPVMWQAITGWIGLDQYDEDNPIGQQFLDLYQQAYGRRPEYCVGVVNRDLATLLLHAFADAHPPTPRGVKESLERIKLLPAASGSPGTRLSFGKWMHRGWVSSGYLVARQLDADGIHSRLVERFGQD